MAGQSVRKGHWTGCVSCKSPRTEGANGSHDKVTDWHCRRCEMSAAREMILPDMILAMSPASCS
jgi:hypothetical protein